MKSMTSEVVFSLLIIIAALSVSWVITVWAVQP